MKEGWGQGKHMIKGEKTWALCTYRVPGNSKPKLSLVETLITVERGFVWGVFVVLFEGILCFFICLSVYGVFFCLWGFYFLVFVCFLLFGLFFGCTTWLEGS